MSSGSTALVTGAAGFCGRHLVAHLVESGYRVVGVDRIKAPHLGVTVHNADIADIRQMQAVLASVQPDCLFHLAALTDPRLPYEELHRVNALGTLSLLQAVLQVSPSVRIVIASTSAVYGRVPEEMLPTGEDQPFCPVNAYGVSKIAQEMVAYQQFVEHGLKVVRTRAFNLTGPGESANFVSSAFARQVASIEADRQEAVLRVGNLETVRDFTDVRDAVQAYRMVAEQGEPGCVYNVCSGRGTAVRKLLDRLLWLCRIREITVQLDPRRLQVVDVPIQVGDPSRLHQITGWVPTIPLNGTLQDVLSYWRQRIHEEL